MTRSAGYLPLFRLFCWAILCWGPSVCSNVQADEGDRFEGAIRSFQLTPKKKNDEKRGGVFRVNGKSLYQKESKASGWDKLVGQKVAGARKKTILVFDDLRTNGGKLPPLKGRAEVNFNSFGEWTGRFVDSDGGHWDFKCSRVQE